MTPKFKILFAFLGTLSVLSALAGGAWAEPAAKAADLVAIYSGEPLAEALYDLVKSTDALLIAHEMATATPLARTDVWRLRDGRLLAVTSRARKLGEPFTIEELRITPDATARLSRKLPPQGSVKIPKSPPPPSKAAQECRTPKNAARLKRQRQVATHFSPLIFNSTLTHFQPTPTL